MAINYQHLAHDIIREKEGEVRRYLNPHKDSAKALKKMIQHGIREHEVESYPELRDEIKEILEPERKKKEEDITTPRNNKDYSL